MCLIIIGIYLIGIPIAYILLVITRYYANDQFDEKGRFEVILKITKDRGDFFLSWFLIIPLIISVVVMCIFTVIDYILKKLLA